MSLCVLSMLGMCLAGSGSMVNMSTQCRGQERKFLNKPQGGVYSLTEPVDNPCRTQGVPTNSQIYTHSEVLTEVSRYPSLTSMEMSHYCRIKCVLGFGCTGRGIQNTTLVFNWCNPFGVCLISAAVINTPSKRKLRDRNSSFHPISHSLSLGSRGIVAYYFTQYYLRPRTHFIDRKA